LPYTHPGSVCGAAKSLVLHFKSLDDLPMKIARRDGKRFIDRADDLLTGFLSLERDPMAPKANDKSTSQGLLARETCQAKG
jgi:hypothetical protein